MSQACRWSSLGCCWSYWATEAQTARHRAPRPIAPANPTAHRCATPPVDRRRQRDTWRTVRDDYPDSVPRATSASKARADPKCESRGAGLIPLPRPQDIAAGPAGCHAAHLRRQKMHHRGSAAKSESILQ